MKTSSAPKILLVCGDPGGANALVPVIRKINMEKKGALQIFAYREAIEILLKSQLSFTVLDEKITDSDVYNLIRGIDPAIIITGTSVNYIDLEKKFILSARELKIPCLTVLDFWANYSQRFSNDDGSQKYIPDKIAIMDELAYDEMLAEGFPPESLVITGQPAFDTLAEFKSHFNNEIRKKIRGAYQIKDDEIFIVFVSQELAKWFGDDDSNPQFLGYTEYSVMDDLIVALEKLSSLTKKTMVLLIRPHPCEKPEKYLTYHSNSIRIVVSGDGGPRDIVMSSDLVIGMNTELLIEACYLGCIVVSLQPGLRFKDFVPTNERGYSIPIYSRERILETLNRTLFDQNVRSEITKKVEHFIHHGNATNRVVNTVYQMMKQ